ADDLAATDHRCAGNVQPAPGPGLRPVALDHATEHGQRDRPGDRAPGGRDVPAEVALNQPDRAANAVNRSAKGIGPAVLNGGAAEDERTTAEHCPTEAVGVAAVEGEVTEGEGNAGTDGEEADRATPAEDDPAAPVDGRGGCNGLRAGERNRHRRGP